MEGDFEAGRHVGGGDIRLFIASESTDLWKIAMWVLNYTLYISREPASGIESRKDGFRTELRITFKVFFTLNKTQIHGVFSVVFSKYFTSCLWGAIPNHIKKLSKLLRVSVHSPVCP
jgi:hypothetical protein